jgi:hypothetical protein
LRNAPVLKVRPSEKVNLLIDGTYFGRDLCLIIYRDNNIKYTQFYRITDGEWYEEFVEDLINLLSLGVQIESITCDGHKSLLKAIRKACKHVILQRCVIHVQHMCRIWLTMNPKSLPGIELRRIVSQLHMIKNREDWGYWIVNLNAWHERHQDYLKEKSYHERTGRYWSSIKWLEGLLWYLKRPFLICSITWIIHEYQNQPMDWNHSLVT